VSLSKARKPATADAARGLPDTDLLGGVIGSDATPTATRDQDPVQGVTLGRPWLRGGARVDDTGALEGDDLLCALAVAGFRVRRYAAQAALDDESGLGRVPPMAILYQFADRQEMYAATLIALKAPDQWPDAGREARR
jgi:hypothetical protein